MPNRKSVPVNTTEEKKAEIIEAFEQEGAPPIVATALMRRVIGESCKDIAPSVDRSESTIRRWVSEHKHTVEQRRERLAGEIMEDPKYYAAIDARLDDAGDKDSRTGALSMKSVTDLTHPRGGGPLVTIDQRSGPWGSPNSHRDNVVSPEELKGLSSEQLSESIKAMDAGAEWEELEALWGRQREENRLRDEGRANGAKVRVVEMTDEEFEAFKNRPRGVTVIDAQAEEVPREDGQD